MRSFFQYVRTSFFYPACSVRFVLAACLLHLATGSVASADNGIVDTELVFIENTQAQGLIHTEAATIWKLLPRSVPGEFTRAELAEFERRIRNLSLFDHVEVDIQNHRVAVGVHEKFTLSPS